VPEATAASDDIYVSSTVKERNTDNSLPVTRPSSSQKYSCILSASPFAATPCDEGARIQIFCPVPQVQIIHRHSNSITMSDSDLDSRPTTPLPEAGDAAGNLDRAISEERDAPPARAANPPLDMDNEDNGPSDNESELSEVDEGEFADFDPTTVALEDRPLVDIDEDIARTLKAGKRKKSGEAEGKKVKEGKREKKKKRIRDEDGDPDGQEIDGKRVRKPKSVRIDGDRKERERAKERQPPTPENEENLTPEERRRRALDRAMDAALKNPNKRRRKKDEVVRLMMLIGGSDSNCLTRTSKRPLTMRSPLSRFEWSKHARQTMMRETKANLPFTSSRCCRKLSLSSIETLSNTPSSILIPTFYSLLNSSLSHSVMEAFQPIISSAICFQPLHVYQSRRKHYSAVALAKLCCIIQKARDQKSVSRGLQSDCWESGRDQS
jgi:hypothetical protein